MGNETLLPLILSVESGQTPDPTYAELAQVFPFYVVFDGADDETRRAWDALPVHRLRHHVPLGLGRSIKTAMNRILLDDPNCGGVLLLRAPVSCQTVLNACEKTASQPNTIWAAHADISELKGKAKNRMFQILTQIVGGRDKSLPADVTLIGFPQSFLQRAVVFSGDSGNYLLELFLSLRRESLVLRQLEEDVPPAPPLPISMRGWLRMLGIASGFLIASMLSFIVDYGLFALLYYAIGLTRTPCAVISRIVSSALNFTINRTVIFRVKNRKGNLWMELLQYYTLVGIVLLLNIALLALFNGTLGIPVLISKAIAEVILFVFNYFVQRDVIFREKQKN